MTEPNIGVKDYNDKYNEMVGVRVEYPLPHTET